MSTLIRDFREEDADEIADLFHIDCFYTHKDYQRQGVGKALYAHLLSVARNRGLSSLHVEASEIAKPFFEREGLRLEKTNRVERGGRFSRIIR